MTNKTETVKSEGIRPLEDNDIDAVAGARMYPVEGCYPPMWPKEIPSRRYP